MAEIFVKVCMPYQHYHEPCIAETFVTECMCLQVGNKGLTENEQRSHFALWSLLKSPLFIGADLRSLSKSALEILTASEVIAVNQDPLGVAGDLIWKEGPLEVSTGMCIMVHITELVLVICHAHAHGMHMHRNMYYGTQIYY